MNRFDKRVGYAVAIVGCTVVLLIRIALSDALAEQARLMPFVIAVMAAAWWGGLGPGILATLLSTFLGILFIVPPANSLEIVSLADAVNATIFVFLGLSISFLCDALHRARRSEAEKQFHTLADTIAQLVWMARPDGYRFWFNQRWYDYSGLTLEQLLGDGWQTVCDTAELPRVLKSWHAALAKGEAWEETYPLRRHDGQMRWHLARAIPVRDARGDIECWFGTSTDIQDRIEIEQTLKDADLRKNQFLATLAHELRNPLSPISNSLQLWPHVENDKEALEQVRSVIERQLQQLVRLIDDLMDLSRIGSGKISLRREPIDLSHVIARAVETAQPGIDAQCHRLTVTMPDEPIYISGDAARLTQVFSNILNNAAKYTVQSGLISLVAQRRGEQAVVRIRDNGPGIPASMLSEIFSAFRQVDSSLSRSHGGLGIGLWLARQIVELHGGTIVATSEGPGQGSEFVVALPALTAISVRSPDGQRDRVKPLAQPDYAVQHRILVVDDVHESAETLAMVLRSMGHDATALCDGETAIQWIIAHRPDAVFLDIAMPGLDGYEVARRLREHPELHEVVLVALTGYGQQEDRRRALDAGFNFHLTKPTAMTSLRELLSKLPAGRTTIEAAAH
jgi:two-component system CheB/CheR fusion protein